MPTSWDFKEYIGKDLPLKNNEWVTIPKSRYVPTTHCILTPNVYINAKFVVAADARRDGILWIRLMRENPNDSTMNYYIWLPRGHTTALDSRSFQKRWSAKDVDDNRAVHLEAYATGVTSAYLNDTCYVSYSQVW